MPESNFDPHCKLKDEQTPATLLEEVAKDSRICDRCLGRLVATVGHGVNNATRGRLVRKALSLKDKGGEDPCTVCRDLFDELDNFVTLVCAALEDYQFENFLVGSRVDEDIKTTEEALWSKVGASYCEPIKTEVNRRVGKRVGEKLGIMVEFENPDIVAIIDTRFDSVEVQVSPLFILGRYRKKSRIIPQTRWPCRQCRGKGCDHCDGTGKMYPTSVEEEIGRVILDATKGEEHFFHGMGREDIDARMLGNGRPFILEVRAPRIRSIDLGEHQDRINTRSEYVEVRLLRSAARSEIATLKEAVPDKLYEVRT